MAHSNRVLAMLVLAALGASCGDDGGRTDGSASGGATSGIVTLDDEPRLDVAADGTAGAEDGGNLGGCKKIDVILSVDNSSSMSEEHEALRGPVFDSFPQALLAVNGGLDDFHLAVIDACPKPAYFHDTGIGGACNFSTGANSMVSSSPELAQEFACVTNFSPTGYMGQPDMCIDDGSLDDDDEQPGLTAAAAVTGEALMGPNAGFLRDDALLFIVTITDEDEKLADVGTTQEIFDQIVEAKGGDVNKVVYLGIAGGSFCVGPYGTASDAVQAKALADLFATAGRGMFWDLCMGELETAFQTAIESQVDSACVDFIPEG
ncbi:hypothetical protein [Paraliomyxa miuraensis]|uniref:hypothetical protein n=1 Tax=Paraliomyxa miuraensis TaxID=376150 RepID=UPI00224E2DDB|nr:hypothetical protein [Paraliomyxa miuraensis]MCX4243866.1 hypothetical protein [Paraliomyxa miuraensis]